MGLAGRHVPLAPGLRHGRSADWDQAKAEYGALAHEVGDEVEMAEMVAQSP